MVQPFDVAWQRTDGLDLRDDALLRDSKQDAGRGELGLTVQPGVHVAQRAPRSALETVDAGHRAVVQPFDVRGSGPMASALASLWPWRSRWMNCPPVICPVLSVAMAIRALRPG